MDSSRIFNVKNRSAGIVVYSFPEDHIRKEFAPGEVKKVTYGELERLSYQPGGKELMLHFLQIQDVEATEDLGIPREPEYDMSESDVVELIQNGSLDAFLDCLDFAGIGVIDLIKKFAVELPMNDFEKRKALLEKTGFDVDKAIANELAVKAENENNESNQAPERRVKPVGGRRTTAPKYTIVTPKES